MINEKILELLLLERILEKIYPNYRRSSYASIVNINGIDYDGKGMIKRYMNLLEEFLEPYVIESDSKE